MGVIASCAPVYEPIPAQPTTYIIEYLNEIFIAFGVSQLRVNSVLAISSCVFLL